MSTSANSNRLIAVFGATGQQGGAIVRALQARGQFRVRALSRNPDQHRGLADEVVEANLDQPDRLAAALRGVHGVFLVTNFWSEGTDERKQATAAIEAAKAAGVEHFIWSTLPNVEAITGGTISVPHFTGKAKVDPIVATAGFAHHTFVVAPFYYQNLLGTLPRRRSQTGPWAGLCLLTPMSAASTWATFVNSATWSPVHSRTPTRQAMASTTA